MCVCTSKISTWSFGDVFYIPSEHNIESMVRYLPTCPGTRCETYMSTQTGGRDEMFCFTYKHRDMHTHSGILYQSAGPSMASTKKSKKPPKSIGSQRAEIDKFLFFSCLSCSDLH